MNEETFASEVALIDKRMASDLGMRLLFDALPPHYHSLLRQAFRHGFMQGQLAQIASDLRTLSAERMES